MTNGSELDITAAQLAEEEDFAPVEITGRSPRQIAWIRFKRNRVGMAAAILSITILAMSIFAPVIAAIFQRMLRTTEPF